MCVCVYHVQVCIHRGRLGAAVKEIFTTFGAGMLACNNMHVCIYIHVCVYVYVYGPFGAAVKEIFTTFGAGMRVLRT